MPYQQNPKGTKAGDWGYDTDGKPFDPFGGKRKQNSDGSWGSVALGNYIARGSIIGDIKEGKRKPDIVKDVGDSLTGGAVTPIVSTLPDFLNKLSNPYLWKRIGIGVMGGLFIWWGVLAFLATNKKLQSAITTGAKGALSKTPQGALANLASDAIGS